KKRKHTHLPIHDSLQDPTKRKEKAVNPPSAVHSPQGAHPAQTKTPSLPLHPNALLAELPHRGLCFRGPSHPGTKQARERKKLISNGNSVRWLLDVEGNTYMTGGGRIADLHEKCVLGNVVEM